MTPGGREHAGILEERLRAHLPDELKAMRSFILWEAGERAGGGVSKRPVRYYRGGLEAISAYDLRGHMRFEQAMTMLRATGASGVGLVLQPWDAVVAVDLDHVVQDGALDELAQGIVGELGSYAEYSPSGRGVHVWTRGTLPEGSATRRGRVEMLRRGLVTLTGQPLRNAPTRVYRRDQELLSVYAQHVAPPQARPPVLPAGRLSGGDQAILDRAFRAANGERFRRLFATTELEERSASQQDYRLALMLLFWCRGDVERARRLMLASRRVRPRWLLPASADGRTYLDVTLNRAASMSTTFQARRPEFAAVPEIVSMP